MSRDIPLLLRLASLWVVFTAWASATGWILSSLDALHTKGYLFALLPLVAAFVWIWQFTKPEHASRLRLTPKQLLRRFQLPFLAWLVITLLVLVGGLLHPPSNYDGLSYRLPRMYHWLQEHHWHWINGIDFRLNIAGAGFEWMSAPLVALFRTDRWLFVLNFVPFLFLPGLFFLAACGIGLRPRIAHWWMWAWPMAYGITHQAGSIGNDMIGATFFLASLAFAFQALKGRPLFCLTLSALAAVSMTSIKVTMLPLGLPLFVVWLWIGWKLLPPLRLFGLGAILALPLALCSFVPMAVLCWKETGAWNGNPNKSLAIEVKHPLAGLIGNGSNLAVGILAPPLVPGAGPIDRSIERSLSKTNWYPWTQDNYPAYNLTIGPELPSEEQAGVGIGVTLLVVLWIWKYRKNRGGSSRKNLLLLLFNAGMAVATLAFILKAGGDVTARLMLPWTPGLLIGLLGMLNGISKVPNPLWSLLPAIMVVPGLLLSPNRPLVPTEYLRSQTILPPSLTKRIDQVYGTYAARYSLLAPFVRRLPTGSTVGFAGGPDDSASALFRPLNSRRVLNLNEANLNEVRWIVGTEAGIERRLGVDFESWTEDQNTIRFQQDIVSKVNEGPVRWFLIERTNL